MQLKEIKKYHDNGKVWVHYFEDEQKRKQGKFNWFHSDGAVGLEFYWKNGLMHGKYINYNHDLSIDYIKYYWYDKEVTKAEFLRKKYNEAMKCS